MYLISARGKTGSLSIATDTATSAISKLRAFQADGFQTIVLDVRGRECAIDQLEAEVANETRALAALNAGLPPKPTLAQSCAP